MKMFEEVAVADVKLGDVVVMDDELTGVVREIAIATSRHPKLKADGGRMLTLRVPFRDSSVGAARVGYLTGVIRRMTPVAADAWMQGNLP